MNKRRICALLCAALMAGTTLTACGRGKNKNEDTTANETMKEVSISEIADAVKAEFGDMYLPNMDMDAEMVESKFGVKPEWVEEYFAQDCMIGYHIDKLLIFKAKDGYAADIKAALADYQEYEKNNALQYPQNIEKIASATLMEKGDYILYFMLGGYDDNLDPDDTEGAFKYFQAQNKRAEDVINGLYE
ncbi:MAG: DUF4358 domain-containing protein [Clostridia bacterium]|nr:DUF4358 domain-containing protein [Clostridia bacterium]